MKGHYKHFDAYSYYDYVIVLASDKIIIDIYSSPHTDPWLLIISCRAGSLAPNRKGLKKATVSPRKQPSSPNLHFAR